MEFYKKYRPRTLKAIVGQSGAVNALQSLIDRGNIPHFLLLSGPSGCGKTTVARIMKSVLECADEDYIERNSADFRGIDTVREIRKHINLLPIAGKVRLLIIDEAHKLTGDAQEAFLKMLEDTPEHFYIILATTDPDKLKKAIHTRGTEIVFKEVDESGLVRVMNRVLHKEGLEIDEQVIKEIAERSEGSPRKSLVLLEQVAGLETKEEQLKAIEATTFNKDAAIDLCRELMGTKPNWRRVCEILKSLQDQDPEGIRYAVLGYANSVLIGKRGAPATGSMGVKCFKILEIFGENFYSSKIYGLTAACYELVFSD